MVKLERMDWENTKTLCKNLIKNAENSIPEHIRQVMMTKHVNELIIAECEQKISIIKGKETCKSD